MKKDYEKGFEIELKNISENDIDKIIDIRNDYKIDIEKLVKDPKPINPPIKKELKRKE